MPERVHSVVEERQAMSTRWESSAMVDFMGALKWGMLVRAVLDAHMLHQRKPRHKTSVQGKLHGGVEVGATRFKS